MQRRLRYLHRPQLYAIEREQKRLGIHTDKHEHPPWKQIPARDRLVIIFAHPMQTTRTTTSLVFWERKGIAFWMDVPFSIATRLPTFVAEGWQYRL